MSAPYYTPPVWSPPPKQPDKEGPTPTEQRLLAHYAQLRLAVIDLEKTVCAGALADKDDKEFDKAIILLKVGMKLIKKWFRAAGYRGRLKPTLALAA